MRIAHVMTGTSAREKAAVALIDSTREQRDAADFRRLLLLAAIAVAAIGLVTTMTLMLAQQRLGVPLSVVDERLTPKVDVKPATGYSQNSGSIMSLQLDSETSAVRASRVEADSPAFAPLDSAVLDQARSDQRVPQQRLNDATGRAPISVSTTILVGEPQ